MKNKQTKFKSSNLLDPRILEKARDSDEILSYTIEFLKRFDSFGAGNIARMIFTDRLFYSLTNSNMEIIPLKTFLSLQMELKNY